MYRTLKVVQNLNIPNLIVNTKCIGKIFNANYKIVRAASILTAKDQPKSKEWRFKRKILRDNKECILFSAEDYYEHLKTTVNRSDGNSLNILKGLGVQVNYDIIQMIDNNQYNLSSAKCQRFLSQSLPIIDTLADDQHMEIIKLFAYWANESSKKYSHLFDDLFVKFDGSCSNRLKDWDLNTVLFVFDVWHGVPRAESTKFVKLARELVMKKFRNMNYGQMLQTVYYLDWMQLPLSGIERFTIEKVLETKIENMSIDEVSFFCIGFFRTQTKFESKIILANIYLKFLETDIRLLEDIAITNILKVGSLLFHNSKLVLFVTQL